MPDNLNANSIPKDASNEASKDKQAGVTAAPAQQSQGDKAAAKPAEEQK
jgi:hypothetical protein